MNEIPRVVMLTRNEITMALEALDQMDIVAYDPETISELERHYESARAKLTAARDAE